MLVLLTREASKVVLKFRTCLTGEVVKDSLKNGKDIGMKVTETFKLIWKSNLLVSFSVDSIDHLCLNQLNSLKLTPSSSSLPSKVNRKSTHRLEWGLTLVQFKPYLTDIFSRLDRNSFIPTILTMLVMVLVI